MSIQTVVRAGNWWSSKIPPLLAIAYAEILLHQTSPSLSLRLVLATFWSLCAVASYGHVINDIFDIEQDRLAGKRNFMAPYGPVGWVGFSLLTVALGIVPILWVNVGLSAWILLLINYLLPTVYSIPPLRFKERGVLGVLCDTAGAHAIPTLFIATAFANNAESSPAAAQWFMVVAGLWAFLLGLKGILNHMIADRASDILGGARTFAVDTDPTRALRFMNRILYWLEILAFAGVVWILTTETTVLLPLLLLYCAIEIIKGGLGWKFSFDKSGAHQRRNVPFANNRFYELWFPVALVARVAIENPQLYWLPLVHLWLFRENLQEQAHDLVLFSRSLYRYLRNLRYKRRFHAVLELQADCSAKLVTSRADPNVVRAEVFRTTGTPWHIKALHGSSSVTAGSWYRLRLRARSDSPRRIQFGLCQPAEPWEGLGLAESVPLQPRWETYLADFVATRDDPAAAVYLWLGAEDAAVEVADICCAAISGSDRWVLDRAEGNLAYLTQSANDRNAIHVAINETTSEPVAVKLSHGDWSLREGEAYVLAFQARGGMPRRMMVSVSQKVEPWADRGLQEEVVLGESFQEYTLPFLATHDEQSASVAFGMGGYQADVEIAGIKLHSAPAKDSWRLETVRTGLAHRALLSEGGVSIFLDEASSTPDDIKLCHGSYQLRAGQCYRVRFQCRADAARKVTVAVSQVHSPWEGLGLSEQIAVGTEFQEYMHDFVALKDERSARLQLGLASSRGRIDVREATIEEISERESWMLSLTGMAKAHIEQPATLRHGARLVVSESTTAVDAVKLSHGRFRLIENQSYSVSFRAQASETVIVRIGVAKSRSPWTDLGLSEAVAIGRAWQTYRFDFIASGSAPDATISFFVGLVSAAIELAGVVLHDSEHNDPWKVDSYGGALLARVQPAAIEEAVSVRFLSAQPGEGGGKLVRGHWPVTEGHVYRLAIAVSASGKEPVECSVTVRQCGAPWEGVGLSTKLLAGLNKKRICFDFVASRSESSACLELGFLPFVGVLSAQDLTLQEISLAELWELSANEDAVAHIVRSKTGPSAVEIVRPGNRPFDLKLTCYRRSLEAGKVYCLSARLRASHPHDIAIGVSQTNAPWTNLGLQELVPLTGDWDNIRLEFVANATDEQAGGYLLLGRSQGRIEIDSIRLDESENEQIWSLQVSEAARASRALLPGEVVRVTITEAAPEPMGVKLLHGPWRIAEGSSYYLSFRARAEGQRGLHVVTQQNRPPWERLGPSQEVVLVNEWQTFLSPFRANADASDANVVFGLGDSKTAVEIGDLELVPAVHLPIYLEVAAGCQAQLVASNAMDGVRLEILRANGIGHQIKLVTGPYALARGKCYEIRFQATSDLARWLTVGVGQSSAPWQNLGLDECLQLQSTLSHYQVRFLAIEDEPEARIYFFAGEEATNLDIADVQLTEIEAPLIWRIEARGKTHFHKRLEESPEALKLALFDTSSTAAPLKVSCAPWKIEKGRQYRLCFLAQSDVDCPVRISVAESHAPWEGLGLYDSDVLTSTEESFFRDFTASRDHSLAAAQIECLGPIQNLSLRHLAIIPIAVGDQWRLERHRDCRVRLRSDEGFPRQIRIQIDQTDGLAEHVRLSHGHFHLRARTPYEIRFRARADRESWIGFVANAVNVDRAVVSHSHTAPLISEWQSVSSQFVSGAEEREVTVSFSVGEEATMVEIGDVEIVEIPAPTEWQVSSPPGVRTHLEGYEGGGVLRSNAATNLDGSYLMIPLGPIEKGALYELRFRGRSSAVGSATIDVASSGSAQRGLGLHRQLDLRPEWSEFRLELQAEADESFGTLIVRASGVDWLEMTGPKLGPISPGDRWTNFTQGKAEAHLVSSEPQAGSATFHLSAADSRWDQIRLVHGLYELWSWSPVRIHLRARCQTPGCLFIDFVHVDDVRSGLGLGFTCPLQEEWQEYSTEFRPQWDASVSLLFQAGAINGTLEIADLRVEPIDAITGWTLAARPGIPVHYLPPGDAPYHIVALKEASKHPSDVRLLHELPPMVRGQWCSLFLSLKAESARSAVLSLYAPGESDRGLGLYDRVALTSEWQRFRWDFEASEAAEHPVVGLLLGGEVGQIEVGELSFERSSPEAHWRLTKAGDSQATLLDGPEGRGVVAVIGRTTGAPGDVTLTHGRYFVKSGHSYRVTLVVRSEATGWIGVIARQGVSPWSNLGLGDDVEARTDLQSIFRDFVATRNDEQLTLQLSLGALAGAVEIHGLKLEESPESYPWQIGRHPGCRATLSFEDQADRTAVQLRVVESDGDPWHLTLFRLLPALNAMTTYRVRFRLRSSVETVVPCSIAQGHAPWDNLGWHRQVAVGPQDMLVDETFVAKSQEELPRFVLAVGKMASSMELSEFTFEEVIEPLQTDDEPENPASEQPVDE